MATKKKVSERTDALLKKQREIAERIKRSAQRDRSDERKARNRALFLIGVAVELQIKRQPSYAQGIIRLAKDRLTKDEHKEIVIAYLDALSSDLASPMPTQAPPAIPGQQAQPAEGSANA